MYRNYPTIHANNELTVAVVARAYASSPDLRRRRFNILRLLRVAAFAMVFTGVGAIGATYMSIQELMAPGTTDQDSLKAYNPDDPIEIAVNEHISNHPLARKLREDGRFSESRPHLKVPEAVRPYNLTAGVLLGHEKIVVPPLVFGAKDGSELVSIVYLGRSLCGHPTIIHGGLLATLLDEGLARCCFPALPNKRGVTASLKVDYRKPCRAGSYVVLRAKTIKIEGRKAWVKGSIEYLADDDSQEEPQILCEAEALYIEPRSAAVRSTR